MSSHNRSVIRVYGDILDYLLAAHGESKEQWDAPFDPTPILPRVSSQLSECGLTDEQLQLIREEIADIRLHILIGVFNVIFRNGYHPQRVVRNIYKLAKLYCPESIKSLSHSDLAILTSDTISASSMRSRACNKFLDSMTPEQVESLIATHGSGALHKLAQLSWTSHKPEKKKRRRKKSATKNTPKKGKVLTQATLELPL